MNKIPYQIFREELINWISSSTGLNHINSPINDTAKEGYFTVVSLKGESISKNIEVEYYKFRFYRYVEKLINNYSALHNFICEIRANVFNAIEQNYESSQAGIIDFDYISYEYDYDKGILELSYSFDFEKQFYMETEIN